MMNKRHKIAVLKKTTMFFLRGVIIITLLSIQSAYATCSFVNGASKVTMTISPRDKTRLPSVISETSTSYTVSGSALALLYNVTNTFTPIVNCTEGETLIIGNSDFPVDAATSYLLTNIPGVYLNAQAQSTYFWVYPYNGGNYERTLDSSGNITPAFLTVSNAATGYVIGHTILMGQMLSGGIVNSGLVLNMTTSDGLDIIDVYMSSFTVTVPTCTVNNYDSSVELGTAYSQRLKSVGTTSNKTPFSINMTCASTTLKPTITFSGNTADGYPSVLANNGDATGIGVQLLYGNNILTPNAVTSLGQATTTAAKDYNFSAQLYQTASPVTAGTIDATATFTINYE